MFCKETKRRQACVSHLCQLRLASLHLASPCLAPSWALTSTRSCRYVLVRRHVLAGTFSFADTFFRARSQTRPLSRGHCSGRDTALSRGREAPPASLIPLAQEFLFCKTKIFFHMALRLKGPEVFNHFYHSHFEIWHLKQFIICPYIYNGKHLFMMKFYGLLLSLVKIGWK